MKWAIILILGMILLGGCVSPFVSDSGKFSEMPYLVVFDSSIYGTEMSQQTALMSYCVDKVWEPKEGSFGEYKEKCRKLQFTSSTVQTNDDNAVWVYSGTIERIGKLN